VLYKLLKVLNKGRIKLYYWWHTRKLSDSMEVQIPLPDFENNVSLITLTGNLAKPFAWVELNLLLDPIWEEDHARAFYQSMIDLWEADQLTESIIFMHLHPETYETEVDEEECVDFKAE
jgi:hypothetical protein